MADRRQLPLVEGDKLWIDENPETRGIGPDLILYQIRFSTVNRPSIPLILVRSAILRLDSPPYRNPKFLGRRPEFYLRQTAGTRQQSMPKKNAFTLRVLASVFPRPERKKI